MYDDPASCPDELLLFFHHVPYTHILHSGKTVIQHIYDSHFDGADNVRKMLEQWKALENKISADIWAEALRRMELQLENAINWRDTVNTYFYRKSGIDDEHGRKIYR